MAAEPIYIESDEEIPEIIDRLRRSAGTEISLMLPSHSRLGQSRFNFRLLQEYATRLGKRVMIISPDPAIQEMAAETGLGAGAPAVGAVGSAPPPIGAFGSPAPPMAAAGLAGAAFVPSPVVPVDAAPSRIHFSAGAAPASALAGLRPGRTGLYVGALLVLVAGILGMVFYVPSASITLVAQAKPFSAPVTLDAAPGSGSIKVRTSNDSQSTTASFKATGTFTVPATHATGTVVVTYGWNPSCGPRATGGYTFSPGQDFTAPGPNLLFTEATQVTVGINQPTPIPVTAVNAGAAGNVGANTITEINGNPPPCLVVNNPSAATGGADAKSNPQITSGDVQGAQATMDQDLRRQIAADFTKQVQSGEKLSDAIVFQPPSFSTDHAPGDQVASFNATMTLKAEGAFYNASQAQKALVAAARAKVPAGQQMTDGTPQVTYTVTGTSGGHLTFTGTVGSYVAQQLDLQQIKSQVVAKSVSQARATLAKLPVNSAEIVQSPFKLPWMPLLGSRVKVNYVVQQGSAAAAPAA